MSSEHQDSQSTSGGGAAPGRPRAWKATGWIALFAFLVVVGLGVGVVIRAYKGKANEAGGERSIGEALEDFSGTITNPRGGFPGKDKIVICCMGIDDNWTNSDEEYTEGARTDTLFLLTLDLNKRTATMLSIPRDAYVPIAGTDYSDKINAAYASGGPKRTVATVSNWLGFTPDYYMVLNIDATKKLVDALGGVDVNVEHKMDYDDNWGQLHVHLLPGFQHLDGASAVAFARYRHGNKGITPEDGDERRMYRQHVLFKSMIVKAKTFSSLMQANNLIDTGMECVRTNLTRAQLFDLAAMFHGLDQDNQVTTASMVGKDGKGPNGVYVMVVDHKQALEYVDWLVNGNEAAGRALTPVRIANGTTTDGLAAQAVGLVKQAGFTDAKVSAAPPATPAPATTQIVDGGVSDHAAAAQVAAAIGMPNAPVVAQPVQPNKSGWSPSPSIRVILGPDYAAAHAQVAGAAQ
jgi:LCP family protein required for cell wall assembly